MKANKRANQVLGRDESAVSPVIAVILMVAITVVLAATVYVWVSGFAADGDQAPSASFKVVNCDTTGGDVTVKLISGGPLQLDDLTARFFHVTAYSEGTQNGDDVTFSSGTWSTGGTQVIALTNGDGFSSDNSYSLDLVHTPTQQIIAGIDFTC